MGQNPTILSHVWRLKIDYEGEAGPPTLFLKTRNRDKPEVAKFGHHEIAFYRRLAPETPAGILVHCHDAHLDETTGDWLLLLEDLRDTHEAPSQWPLPPRLDSSESVIRTFARFHAAWWDDKRLGVTIGAWGDSADVALGQQRMTSAVAKLADSLGDRFTPDKRAFYERLIERTGPLSARYHSRRNMTIVHGDTHVWNCWLPKPGIAAMPKLFDWDSWRLDYATDDLAYQIALHWYPDLRREREGHLLDIYHDELVKHGVTGYDRPALQDDYRLSVLWMTMKPVWQHEAGIPALIWWSHLARIHLAVEDLGCRELLD